MAAGEAEVRAMKAATAAGVVLKERLAVRQAKSVATKGLRAVLGSWEE